MAGQLATASFDHQHPQAPDNRMQRPNLNARNEISPWIRWEGMQVYVVQEQKTYQLVGGTGNEHWQEIAAGGGASNFVGQFPTFEDLPDSGSPGDYAYVGTGDDFVQYNWDQIAGEWRLNSAETKVSDEDFFLGRVPSEPDRVMFSMRRNSIIYSTGGTQSISPDRMANYVFTGENVTLENVNYSGDGGEEFHITNRTGSNLTILSTGNFASGLTIPAGHMASFKSSDDGWVQSFVNEEATFSDTLDSVNATRSIGPDGLEVITGVYDKHTGVEHQYKEFTGTPPAVEGILFVQAHGKTFINAEYLKTGQINLFTIGCRSEPGFDNSPILNYYLSIPGFNHFIIPETDSPFEIFEIIDIVDRHGLTIEGGHLKVNPSATRQRLHVFEIFDSSDLTFRNLIIEGSGQLETYTEPTARGHGIRIISTSKKVLIDNVRFKNLGSDGIYINDASGDEACKDISIINSHFNKVTRNCISVINGENILIDNCTFDDWKLCAIDMEPNAPTSNIPLRDVTVSNNVFTKHPGQQSEHRSVVQASTGAASEMDRDLIGNINILHNNFFNNGTIGVSVRTANFKKCRIIGNTMNGAKASSIYLGASYNSTCAFNVIENSYADSFIDQSPNTGAISVWGSRNIVFGNHIDASSYHGIWCSYTTAIADRNIISNNYINNIGRMEDWGGVNFSAIRLNNAANTIITGNIINDTEETPSTKVGIQITGSNSIGNSVYDNKISDNIATKINLVNVDKQGLVKNNGTEDVLSYGRVVTSLPTASVDVYGKIFKVKASGPNDDQFYLCIQNSEEEYEWINIFSEDIGDATVDVKGIAMLATQDEVYLGVNSNKIVTPDVLHNKVFKPPLTIGGSGRTFLSDDLYSYLRFIGDTGSLTIPPDIFPPNSEIIGEIEGSQKLFVGGSGVTLRASNGYYVPTGSIFKLKFKSANDVLLTYTANNRHSYSNSLTNPTLNNVQYLSYVRFTGSSGNAIVPPDFFSTGDEIIGEIEGGAKTFVAGEGVTLRYPAGGTNVAPTNSRFFIKFKSPNDAQLTIVPGVGDEYVISSNQAFFTSNFTYDGESTTFSLPFTPIDIDYVMINNVLLPLNLIIWYPELDEGEESKNIEIPSPNGEFLLEDDDRITVRFLYKEV